MRLIKSLCFLFVLLCSIASYAHEDKHIFIGKTGQGDDEKVTFILNLLGDDVDQYVRWSPETGELILKVDSITALHKDALAQAGLVLNTESLLAAEIRDTRDETPDVRCRNCGFYYEPRYSAGRRCPRCGTQN